VQVHRSGAYAGVRQLYFLHSPLVRVRSLPFRVFALLAALVQLSGPAAAAVADAQLEAAGNGPNAASHIEAHGRPECTRVHTDDCALCQYLATAFSQPPAAATPPIVAAAVRPAITEYVGRASGILDAVPRTRAPPVLV
jgi:hypothetical protein